MDMGYILLEQGSRDPCLPALPIHLLEYGDAGMPWVPKEEVVVREFPQKGKGVQYFKLVWLDYCTVAGCRFCAQHDLAPNNLGYVCLTFSSR